MPRRWTNAYAYRGEDPKRVKNLAAELHQLWQRRLERARERREQKDA